MALDTQNKRLAVISIGYGSPAVASSSSLSAGDREQMTGMPRFTAEPNVTAVLSSVKFNLSIGIHF